MLTMLPFFLALGVLLIGGCMLVAGTFGFKDEPFFEAPPAEREAPKVQF